MVQLRRGAPRLLSKVNNRPHASFNDHEDPADLQRFAHTNGKAIAIPEPVTAHEPSKSKPSRLHIPDDVGIYEEPLSSSPSSAEIPQTHFIGLEKETKTKPLRVPGYGTRDNTARKSIQTKDGSLSPDARGLQMHMGPKRKAVTKFAISRNVPNTAKIAAKSATTSTVNIHTLPAIKTKKNERVSLKASTPTQKDTRYGSISVPSPFQISKNSGSEALRIPGLLPTPQTTQTSPSPNNKRRCSDEGDVDSDVKKQKIYSGCFSVGSSPLSSPPAYLVEEELETECKICFQQVDKILVEMYEWPSSHPTMNEKRNYCNWHRTKEAEQEWERKGYPNINWIDLKKQLDRYNSDLERLIEEPETSHYRRELKNKTRGRTHSLARIQKGEDAEMELGFYGYRGLNMMVKHITDNFHDLLRSKSAGDYVMSTNARGVSSYVRLVLAQELATLLIRDDMNLSIERAREILEESRGVGEVLNGKDVQDEVSLGKRRSAGRRYVDENDESDGE